MLFRSNELAHRLANDLQSKGYVAQTISIKVKYASFKTATRDLTLDAPVQSAADLRHAAGLCAKRLDLTQKMRLLGIKAAGLKQRA